MIRTNWLGWTAGLGLTMLALVGCSTPSAAPSASAPAAGPSTSAAPAAAGTFTVQTKTAGTLGAVLADSAGKTLYKYDPDTAGVSNCSGQCATNWPPLMLASGDPRLASGVKGDLKTITRADGGRQVTYDGTPLYYFAQDAQPTDTKGDGVGGVWHIVHPDA